MTIAHNHTTPIKEGIRQRSCAKRYLVSATIIIFVIHWSTNSIRHWVVLHGRVSQYLRTSWLSLTWPPFVLHKNWGAWLHFRLCIWAVGGLTSGTCIHTAESFVPRSLVRFWSTCAVHWLALYFSFLLSSLWARFYDNVPPNMREPVCITFSAMVHYFLLASSLHVAQSILVYLKLVRVLGIQDLLSQYQRNCI